MTTIGSRIRVRREELGMTQEELAKKANYKSRSTINKIELGLNNLKQSKIKIIADALLTTPAYIMGWDEDQSSPFIEKNSVEEIKYPEPNVDKVAIGALLKTRRKELNISVRQCAERLGVSEATWLRWESGDIGKMRGDKIPLLSKCLYLPIEMILGFDTDKPLISSEIILEQNKIQDMLKDCTMEQLKNVEKYIVTFILDDSSG